MTDRDGLTSRADAMGVRLDAATAARISAYLDRVLEINRSVNLTSVRDRDDAVVRHLLDSLSVVPVWRDVAGTDAPRRFLDLGTGGGFPGAVLAAAWPVSQGLLIDGTGKKVRAVADALAAAGIGNAQTAHARGADLVRSRPDLHGAFDLVVARAVASAAEIVREVAPLVAAGGYVLAMKGPEPPEPEIAAGVREARKRGLEPLPARTTRVPGLEPRVVLAFRRPA